MKTISKGEESIWWYYYDANREFINTYEDKKWINFNIKKYVKFYPDSHIKLINKDGIYEFESGSEVFLMDDKNIWLQNSYITCKDNCIIHCGHKCVIKCGNNCEINLKEKPFENFELFKEFVNYIKTDSSIILMGDNCKLNMAAGIVHCGDNCEINYDLFAYACCGINTFCQRKKSDSFLINNYIINKKGDINLSKQYDENDKGIFYFFSLMEIINTLKDEQWIDNHKHSLYPKLYNGIAYEFCGMHLF